MLTFYLVGVSILAVFLSLYKYAVYRPKGYPPGPPRIPFFGSYLFMMMTNFRFLHKAVLKFTEWYKTDIVGFYLGTFPVVAVHDAETIKEVLNSSDFIGRPATFTVRMRDPNFQVTGISLNEGPVWHEQRRFILRHLRDFGFGRRFAGLEDVMQVEITDMISMIREGPKHEHEKDWLHPNGYRILLPCFFNIFSLNSFCHVMFNERFARSEQAEIWKLLRNGMQIQRKSDAYGKMLSIMPWVRHVFPNWSAYNAIKASDSFVYKFFEKIVDHHIATYDESCERNFLDLYIREMLATDSGDNRKLSENSFTRAQLIMSLIDFSLPTMTIIGSQLSFLMQYLLLYPEVQRKIQKEIDEVVGAGRLPTLDDRQYMNYTEATLREILRIETPVPSSIARRAVTATKLNGYDIPKDTVIVTNLYALHNDERVWTDPKSFRPERFLDDNGKLSLKSDVSLPFSAGKRLCAGESFARNILFLICAALCQQFNAVLGSEDKLPDLSNNLGGFVATPYDFWMQFEERKSTI